MDIKEMMAQRAAANECMRLNHIKLVDVEKDHAVTELTIVKDNLNPAGKAHGGVLYTMADCAAGFAAHTDGRSYVTQCSSFHFFRSGESGDTICAEGRVRWRGRRTCYVDLDITDSRGRLLCTGGFTYFCTSAEL